MKIVFPVLLIILNLGAALTYLWSDDWRHVVYFAAAAALTAAVTF